MVHIKDSVHIVLDINEQRCLEMIFDKVGFQFPLPLFYLVIIPGLKENIDRMICGIQFWIDTVLRGLRKIPSLYL